MAACADMNLWLGRNIPLCFDHIVSIHRLLEIYIVEINDLWGTMEMSNPREPNDSSFKKEFFCYAQQKWEQPVVKTKAPKTLTPWHELDGSKAA
jgi:hypothetical protein